MYIPEFVCGFIAGAVVASVVIIGAALWYSGHSKDK